jgi:leucyl aminopeptidase
MQPKIIIQTEAIDTTAQIILIENESVFNKANKHETRIQELLTNSFPDFKSLKKELDFVKAGDKWIFLAQLSDDSEKNRMLGYKIRQQLPKETKTCILSGDYIGSLDVAEGIALSNYQFLKYRGDKKEKANQLHTIYIDGDTNQKKIDSLNNTLQAVYWSRDLVNEPVSYLTASQLSEEIKEKLEPLDLQVTVLEKLQIEALKLGGLIAVNLGSEEPPTFNIIEYKPANAKNKKPIVLVGKGVVYDTGGVSLKPTAHSMDLMKSDMAGAACVAGAMMSVALNQIPLHIVCIIPATDNRPGKNAYVPGDIITMYNGKTVEVLNTDAEGRMILADALAYGDKYNPELVIDAATLTGSAVKAIGTKASCVMGNASSSVMQELIKAGSIVHERLVELPFWDEYGEQVKSDIADLKNLGGPDAGMITAGKFLENFTSNPYIHIDIAGPAFLESEDGYRGKGGTGVGVRLLTQFLTNYTNGK